jgi:chromosomal replication initiation ATPase DnaA
VDRLREEGTLRERIAPAISVAELMEGVAQVHGLEPERVLARSTKRDVADARGVVSYVAVQWSGARGTEVGRVLGVTDSGANRSVARGRAIARRNPDLVPQLPGRRERSLR